jgi:magnesium transporter
MKFLATVTIVLSIPTMIASFFGMNFDNIPLGHFEYGFVIVIILTFVVSGIVAILFRKKDLF